MNTTNEIQFQMDRLQFQIDHNLWDMAHKTIEIIEFIKSLEKVGA